MEAHDIGLINLVRVNYQGTARAMAHLPDGTARDMAVRAFPLSVAPGFRAQGGLEGVKVYRAGGNVAIARFWDGGENDDWGRAVLSARVAVLAEDGWSRWGRDAFLWRDLLDDAGLDDAAPESLDRLARQVVANPVELGPDGIGSVVAGFRFGVDFLAGALVAALASENVVIVDDEAHSGEALMVVLLALMPPERLEGAFCSRCADPASMSHERLVLSDVRPRSVAKQGLLARWMPARAALSPDEMCVIVPSEQQAPVVRSRRVTPDACRAVIHEALRPNTWGTTDPLARHSALVHYLDALSQGIRNAAAYAVSAGSLPPDGQAALMRLAAEAEGVT